jgi:hypothetical protein
MAAIFMLSCYQTDLRFASGQTNAVYKTIAIERQVAGVVLGEEEALIAVADNEYLQKAEQFLWVAVAPRLPTTEARSSEGRS